MIADFAEEGFHPVLRITALRMYLLSRCASEEEDQLLQWIPGQISSEF
jgi:hypothetical protein